MAANSKPLLSKRQKAHKLSRTQSDKTILNETMTLIYIHLQD